MKAMKKTDCIGSTLDSFFEERGELEKVNLLAQKLGMVRIIDAQRRKLGVSKRQLAKLMQTSRSAIDRLLDEDDPGITLTTMLRAAQVLGLRLTIAMDSESQRKRRAA